MHTPHLSRAQILLDQARYDLAAQELGQVIAASPDNAHAFALLARCQSHLKMPQQALKSARHAIHLAPDYPYSHYMLAYVLDRQKAYLLAEKAVLDAVRISPENVSYFALLSQVRVHRGNWKGAVEAAENGLRLNALNATCAGMRAFALIKLGRAEEASEAITRSLANHPESAFTHTVRGWIYLETRKPTEARFHSARRFESVRMIHGLVAVFSQP